MDESLTNIVRHRLTTHPWHIGKPRLLVIPAKAGVQVQIRTGTPAFVGVTVLVKTFPNVSPSAVDSSIASFSFTNTNVQSIASRQLPIVVAATALANEGAS